MLLTNLSNSLDLFFNGLPDIPPGFCDTPKADFNWLSSDVFEAITPSISIEFTRLITASVLDFFSSGDSFKNIFPE